MQVLANQPQVSMDAVRNAFFKTLNEMEFDVVGTERTGNRGALNDRIETAFQTLHMNEGAFIEDLDSIKRRLENIRTRLQGLEMATIQAMRPDREPVAHVDAFEVSAESHLEVTEEPVQKSFKGMDNSELKEDKIENHTKHFGQWYQEASADEKKAIDKKWQEALDAESRYNDSQKELKSAWQQLEAVLSEDLDIETLEKIKLMLKNLMIDEQIRSDIIYRVDSFILKKK